ncbi:MAG: hypothetical protein AAF206_10235 [Bacteroidota bacterium]
MKAPKQNASLEMAEDYADTLSALFYGLKDRCDTMPLTTVVGDVAWKICQFENQREIVFIHFFHDGVTYREEYCLWDGQLVEAIEGEERFYGTADRSEWSCWYHIKGNHIVNYASFGTGKTETDSWEPSSILEQWTLRKAEYNRLINLLAQQRSPKSSQ